MWKSEYTIGINQVEYELEKSFTEFAIRSKGRVLIGISARSKSDQLHYTSKMFSSLMMD